LTDVNATLFAFADVYARQTASACPVAFGWEESLHFKFQKTGHNFLSHLKGRFSVKSLGRGFEVSFACEFLKIFELRI